MEKTFIVNQLFSHIKQYEEIRKSTTRQGEDYIPRCLLYYDYI